MVYLADPGWVFESDAHRRTLGHLPLPGEPAMAVALEGTDVRTLRRTSLVHRMEPDQWTDLDAAALTEILADLEAAGYAAQADGGWAMTQAGLDALNAPVPEEVTA